MWKIAIIEDDPQLLSGLTAFFSAQKEINCILAVNSVGEFFEKCRPEEQIDALLLDIALGTQNGLDHLDKIKKVIPDSKIIIMTGLSDPSYLLPALEAGADSYYLKGSDPTQLPEVISITLRGGTYIAPDIAPELVAFFRRKAEDKKQYEGAKIDRLRERYELNDREMQVVRGLIDGLSYQEIGDSVNIALNTVRHYVKTLYKKLDIKNKVQLIRKLDEQSGDKK